MSDQCFSDETYQKVASVKGFEGVLSSAKRAKEKGLHVEVVTNVIPGFNDNEAELKGLTSWIRDALGSDTPWHVTRFHPHHDLEQLQPTPVATLERAWTIGREAGLRYVYLGNVPGHRLENTYCHTCGSLLIEKYIFDVIKNGIEDGRCLDCGTKIPGKFEG